VKVSTLLRCGSNHSSQAFRVHYFKTSYKDTLKNIWQ